MAGTVVPFLLYYFDAKKDRLPVHGVSSAKKCQMKKQNLLFLFLVCMLGNTMMAQVVPASLFKDHMVLQQGAELRIWGKAAAGETVTVSILQQKKKVKTGKDGKWLITLAQLQPGGPYTLSISGSNRISIQDVYVGEVWLCSGQSNMDMTVAREDRYWCGVHNEAAEVAAANYPLIRVFDTDFSPRDTAQEAVGGTWEVCSPATVGHFSAAAYFFARELYQKYKVPIGLITTAYGASTVEAWTSKKTLEQNQLFAKLLSEYDKKKNDYDTAITAKRKYLQAYTKWQTDSAAAKLAKKDPPRGVRNPDPKADQHMPFVLYNGMVAPLVPYTVKGAIWYQGESNGATKDIYDVQMEAMIRNWREDFHNAGMPFIYVQLANNGKSLDTIPGKGGPMTYVREKQLKNLSIPHTAMVVAIDNADDPANIHPKNKQAIGYRLALAAEAIVYNERVAYSGPVFSSMKTEGEKIRVSFTHTNGGLVLKDSTVTGFAIAGADKKFYWAKALIDGSDVVVASPAVPQPLHVRYAWGENPIIGLSDKAGLPASPFRTDPD